MGQRVVEVQERLGNELTQLVLSIVSLMLNENAVGGQSISLCYEFDHSVANILSQILTAFLSTRNLLKFNEFSDKVIP